MLVLLQAAKLFFLTDGNANQVLTTDGAGTVTWAITLAADTLHLISFDASLIPDTNAAYDLGSAKYKVPYLFLSDSIKFESETWC